MGRALRPLPSILIFAAVPLPHERGRSRLHRSPNRFQQRGLADAFVSSNQGQAFGPRGSANEPVDWISRIVNGELSGKRSNFRSDGFDADP